MTLRSHLLKKYVPILFTTSLFACGGSTDSSPPDNSSPAPSQDTIYTLTEKIKNKPSIPVFQAWAESESGEVCRTDALWFDCDNDETPYSLVWHSEGRVDQVDATTINVAAAATKRMQSDANTVYLYYSEWNYWYPEQQSLSTDSKFYSEKEFLPHVGSEYGTTMMLKFDHPDWANVLAEKSVNIKKQGYNGIILDWWNNNADGEWSDAPGYLTDQEVSDARVNIAKAITEKMGDDFVLMGNTNWNIDDATAEYMSGVFLELFKNPSQAYLLTYDDETNNIDPNIFPFSIERMEDLIEYWNSALRTPKIIAFEPWKITKTDYYSERYSEENIQYAKLFTAMLLVIADNGYILYSDNNPDWDGGDHNHAYYDFYKTDFGSPIGNRVIISDGIGYKVYEKGIMVYNRTKISTTVNLPTGEATIPALSGNFLLTQ